MKFLLSLFALFPGVQEVPAEAEKPDTAAIVLEIAGEPIDRTRFGAWLGIQQNQGLLRLFAEHWLVRQALAEAGIEFDPESARALAREENERRVTLAFGGRREAWIAELTRAGRTPEGLEAERAIEAEFDLCLEALAEADAERDAMAVRQALLAGRRIQVLATLGAPAATAREDDVVMRIDDTPIPRSEWIDWLLPLRGEHSIDRFVLDHRIETAARAAFLEVAPERIAKRLEQDVAWHIERAGSRTAWEEFLADHGDSEEAYRARKRARLQKELLFEDLVRLQRTVRPSDVRAEWERRHGRNGRRLKLRWIRVDIQPPKREAGMSDEELKKAGEAAHATARSRAEALYQRLEQGADFATLAERESDDAFSAARGGVPGPGFHLGLLPPSVRDQLDALPRGAVHRPELWNGSYYLFEVLEIVTVAFESVEAELLQFLRDAPPSAIERSRQREALTAGLRIRKLPALLGPTRD